MAQHPCPLFKEKLHVLAAFELCRAAVFNLDGIGRGTRDAPRPCYSSGHNRRHTSAVRSAGSPSTRSTRSHPSQGLFRAAFRLPAFLAALPAAAPPAAQSRELATD